MQLDPSFEHEVSFLKSYVEKKFSGEAVMPLRKIARSNIREISIYICKPPDDAGPRSESSIEACLHADERLDHNTVYPPCFTSDAGCVRLGLECTYSPTPVLRMLA